MGAVKIKSKRIKTVLIAIGVIIFIGAVLVSIILPLYFTNVSFSDPAEGFDFPILSLNSVGGIRFDVDRQEYYQSHPALVVTNSGTMLITYTRGHGKGPIEMKELDVANGDTVLSERRTDLPESWKYSQEASSLYRLELVDENGERNGEKLLMFVSGCPRWPWTNLKKNGFNCSFSTDDGVNWSEFENFYGRAWAKGKCGVSAFDCVVAMSSLTQLKENGRFVNKWMGTFHTRKCVNYKTILTFDKYENGELKPHWSEPEPILKQWKKAEKKHKLCEIEIIRTPSADGTELSGDTLIMLARNEKRDGGSAILFSDDEGVSWSAPKLLPPALTGDRHKAVYDPASKKLLISFRHINPFSARYSNLGKQKTYLSMGWIGWIGTFDDLLSYREDDPSKYKKGEKSVLFSGGYKNGGDCGYSGVAIVNGYFVGVSYGTFDENALEPYILGVKIPTDRIFGNV